MQCKLEAEDHPAGGADGGVYLGQLPDAGYGVRCHQRLAGAVLSRIFGGEVDTVHGHGVLRKLAHGTEYLILGVELCLLLRPEKPWSTLALSGVLTALLDETIQLFVPERCGQIKDVWIDLGGFTTGVLLCILVIQISGNIGKKAKS